MKKYTPIYLLLLALLATGAFASMAQHSFGLILCAIGCVALCALFAFEAINDPSHIRKVELLVLSLITLIFALRNFSFDFPMSNVVVGILLIALIVIESYHAFKSFNASQRSIHVYYLSVIITLLAMLASQLFTSLEQSLSIFGISFAILFLVLAVTGMNSKSEDSVTPLQRVGLLQDKSAIILLTGLFLGAISLLSTYRIFPPLYRGTLPDAYQTLKDQGNPKAQELKDRYEQFIKHSGQ